MDSYSKIAYWRDQPKRETGISSKNYRLNVSEDSIEIPCDSQNFMLRLSSESNTNNTENRAQKKCTSPSGSDVIVISDSSCNSTPERIFTKRTDHISTSMTKSTCSPLDQYVLELSDSDSASTAKANKKFVQIIENSAQHNQSLKNKKSRSSKKYKWFNSSSSSTESSDKDYINGSEMTNDTESTHVSPTPQITEYNIPKSLTVLNRVSPKRSAIVKDVINSSETCTSTSRSTSASSTERGKTVSNSISTEKNNTVGRKFTKQDLQKIIKNIKSTKAVYESPRNKNVIIDESIDENTHPAISPNTDYKKRNNEIIDETVSDIEDNIIQGSKVDLSKPYKTHVSRFLNGKSEDLGYTDLSERKKQEISKWLTTTSPDSRSDSSFSQISDSNRASVNSGNSSLERLEMVYETPNNRDKIRGARSSERKNNVDNVDQIVQSVLSRQTTIDQYLQKSKTDTLGYSTPDQPTTGYQTRKNLPAGKEAATPKLNTPQNIGIMDCADILDKLYGDVWRSKANELLPSSEPRKPAAQVTKRMIQTEKKHISKARECSTDSEDDDLHLFVQNRKPYVNSTKKTLKKSSKDSFIDDNSSSSSGSGSMYYTALTDPRKSTMNEKEPKLISTTVKRKPTNTERQKCPSTSIIRRVQTICDTDTEDEAGDNDYLRNLNRRKLSFSNDESGSSTSEFEPGDILPPKPTRTKGSTKTPRQVQKVNNKTQRALSKQRNNGPPSFLASLSETVPLANSHPDAKKYRTNFKNNKEELCKYLYKLYNEKVFENKLPQDMLIEWNIRMRGTAGYCYNKKSVKALGGVAKSSRIVLATKILDTPDRLRDTLIHEMCHAAAWLINNVSDGHGPFWTGWANKAMEMFPELPPIRRCHDYKIKTKFTYRCTSCAYSIGRHSKSLDIERKRCGYCYGKFELLINKTTKAGVVQVQTPNRQPSGFALYVKENYGTVKKERNAKHAEIMKILGQQFSAMKVAKKSNINDLEDDPDVSG